MCSCRCKRCERREILSLWSAFASVMKSMLDCLYSGWRLEVFVVGWSTSSEFSLRSTHLLKSAGRCTLPLRKMTSSSIMEFLRSSFALARARSSNLARVAVTEWGQSFGPLAAVIPRAILSRRFGGGIEPLKGVIR